MIDKLSMQLTSFICTEDFNNAKDKARIQYGLNVLLSEGLKIVFLVLLFNMLHRQNYFYFSFIILLTTRVFAGGIHVKSAFNCLLLTTLLFIVTSVLAPLLPRLSHETYIVMGALFLLVILFKAPICSVHRPIKSKKIKLQYKLMAALSAALWIIILIFMEAVPYINCGFATLLVQNIQLILVKRQRGN